jgi:hypothetical protein
MSTEPKNLTPDKPIRRFDVFAEVSRQEALRKGQSDDEASGYGIWLAKVVASRRSRGSSSDSDREPKGAAAGRKISAPPEYHTIGDELQTGEVFDHEIVERMGREFYAKVFRPAIKAALDEGQKYEQFRDTIRKDWKPG